MHSIIEQKEIFLSTEGDQWFDRNTLSDSIKNDKIIHALQSVELSPRSVLEIGCSNGGRLDKIRETFGAKCWGIDPSSRAIEDGKEKYKGISLSVGTADRLQFEDKKFDLIIFGFCLYLCDRSDLFKIAYEADRCLTSPGAVVIYDFYPTFPYMNKYLHRNGVYSYKMDYSLMFKWNPCFSEVSNTVFSHSGLKSMDMPNEKVSVIVLKKNEQYAYLEDPWGS